MNYTRLHTFSEISEMKIRCRAFCTKGLLTHGHWRLGPEAHAARPRWPRAGQAMACLQARRPERRDGAAPGRRGRGPAGPEAHQGVTCGVGLAGDGPAAVKSTAEELGYLRLLSPAMEGSGGWGLGSDDGPAGERRRRRDGSGGQPAGIYIFSAHFSLAVSAIWGRRGKEEGRVIYVEAIGPGSFRKPGPMTRFKDFTGKDFLFSILTFCFHFNRKKLSVDQ
jgi:hypothetical protein